MHHEFKIQKKFPERFASQCPVVQSIVSLISLLMVKILTVLVSTISNSQVFLLKKNVRSFCKCQKLLTFFQQKY